MSDTMPVDTTDQNEAALTKVQLNHKEPLPLLTEAQLSHASTFHAIRRPMARTRWHANWRAV